MTYFPNTTLSNLSLVKMMTDNFNIVWTSFLAHLAYKPQRGYTILICHDLNIFQKITWVTIKYFILKVLDEENQDIMSCFDQQ